MQWQLLLPLTLTSPHTVVAGMLSPAYEVGGDGFDYALNEQTLHVAIVDAMGHGLQAAILAGAVVGAYRHARRAGVSLRDTYAVMDEVVRGQFSDEQFATAHMAELDVSSGLLRWVNAGHPRPLLIRGHRVHITGVGELVPTITQQRNEVVLPVADQRLRVDDRPALRSSSCSARCVATPPATSRPSGASTDSRGEPQ